MSFPSGGPGTGGFPGQGPQQPQQQFPGPPAPPAGGGGMKISLPQILFLATAGLGLLNLFLGFANFSAAPDAAQLPEGVEVPESAQSGVGFYESGIMAWLPMMFFLSGLAALLTILPGEHKPGPWPAIFSLGILLPFLFVTFAGEDSYGAGAVMILIFGIVQTLVAVAAYLFDENIVKPPQPSSQPAGQPGQFGQPGQGGFGQPGPQSGGFPQPGQPGQPGPQGQPGQPPQPVNNPHQQPTTYASQQGQFFQPQESQQPQGGQPGQQGPQQGS